MVRCHVGSDPAFGAALLCEGIDTILAGDSDSGKAILRNYIKRRSALRGAVQKD